MKRLDLRACASHPLIVCVTWDQMQQEPRTRTRWNKAGEEGGREGRWLSVSFMLKLLLALCESGSCRRREKKSVLKTVQERKCSDQRWQG